MDPTHCRADQTLSHDGGVVQISLDKLDRRSHVEELLADANLLESLGPRALGPSCHFRRTNLADSLSELRLGVSPLVLVCLCRCQKTKDLVVEGFRVVGEAEFGLPAVSGCLCCVVLLGAHLTYEGVHAAVFWV